MRDFNSIAAITVGNKTFQRRVVQGKRIPSLWITWCPNLSQSRCTNKSGKFQENPSYSLGRKCKNEIETHICEGPRINNFYIQVANLWLLLLLKQSRLERTSQQITLTFIFTAVAQFASMTGNLNCMYCSYGQDMCVCTVTDKGHIQVFRNK